MSVQTTYKFSSHIGSPGGIVDLTPHAIDSFLNGEETGVMKFGVGVVQGANPGTDVKLPVAASTATVFEGVTVNNRTTEYDLEGATHLRKGKALGVMRYGRVYVRVATGATPAYGDALYLIPSGDEAGYFIDGIDKLPKYVRNIRGVLSAALHDAVKAEIIPKNPAADLDVQIVVKQEPRAMDSELKAAFEAAIKDSPYRNVFLFQINTGTRTSEVLGQRWKDINMRTGEVKITGQLERIRRKGDARTIKDKTKSKKNRSLFLPPFALAYLKDEKRRQNENRLRAGGEWHDDDGLVFTRADGTPIPHRTVEDAFKRIVTRLGHPEFTPHDLRRTFITEEEAAGTDIKTIAAMAGHSSTDLTLNTYTASTDEMKRRAAERKQERHTKT